MFKSILLTIGLMFFVGCAEMQTGTNFNGITPGMNEFQVTQAMGNPDSFADVNGYTLWQWNYRPTRSFSGFEMAEQMFSDIVKSDSRSIANYYVIFQKGAVVQKGTGNPHHSQTVNVNANVNASVIHKY